MRQKMKFSSLLMSILVVCTIMYQSMHSFTHILSEVEQICKSEVSKDHHYHHIDKKHCHICDFTFSPFTTTDFFSYTFFNPIEFSQKYFFSEQTFEVEFIQHSFLRGPPALV